MYVLHIANRNYSSWSLRPWLLMQELGIAFDERLHTFQPGGNAATFRAFSPTGRVPCLVDGATTVWDSLAITEYLAERHGGVWPAAAAARAWARCGAAEMHSGFGALREQCSMNCGIRVQLRAVTAALRADLERLGALWRDGLARWGGPWLAGADFSAVDAFFAPVAFRIQTYGLGLPEDAAAYASRLLELPGMRRWYAAALEEPWRDAEHEADVPRWGVITADLRRAAPAPG